MAFQDLLNRFVPPASVVVDQFSRVAQHERCAFFGNVTLGSFISLSELRQLYDAVLLAYGAESDRVLGVLGEVDLGGIYSAREFVWWYNGHPDWVGLNPDLKSTGTAVILGQGNVALDIAHILFRPTAESQLTLQAMLWVYLVGRRGPVQAACTTEELRAVLGVEPGKKIAVGTEQFEDLGCGYCSKHQRSSSERFTKDPPLLEEGLYVCGWLKREQTGIIGTNLYCAEETVASISEDVKRGLLGSSSSLPKPGREGLLQLLDDRSIRVLPFSAWEKIDSEERMVGGINNKPREKLATWEELLKVAGK
ncbi:NAD(P)-binding domain containing protein [Trema orientale]|uniref:NAD(P)-binding domain containing protein n=1 Tax=Trema orientale TaxID=63057 RepID=A0A2P5FSY1_TREOI|nr:NAD(P)-binding domain containing protein [Trema orientale]